MGRGKLGMNRNIGYYSCAPSQPSYLSHDLCFSYFRHLLRIFDPLNVSPSLCLNEVSQEMVKKDSLFENTLGLCVLRSFFTPLLFSCDVPTFQTTFGLIGITLI